MFRTDASCIRTPAFALDIGEDCTIGHLVMLHGCTIGNGCLIGIGSVILNGAKIGEGSLIGANSLITEGKVIPPRSMVMGSPGKVVRTLTDEEFARLKGSAGALRRQLAALQGWIKRASLKLSETDHALIWRSHNEPDFIGF